MSQEQTVISDPPLNYILKYKNTLKKVFVYYCSFADKDNYSALKLQNYQRMLTDAQIANAANQHLYDIAFYQKGKDHPQHQNLLSFQQFIEGKVSKIALLKFSDVIDPVERVEKLIKIHFQPLCWYLLQNTDFGMAIQHFNRQYFTEINFCLLLQYRQDLLSLYREYFSAQSYQANKHNEFKILSRLSRQVGFTNRIVSQSLNYLLFQFLLNLVSKHHNYSRLNSFNQLSTSPHSAKTIGGEFKFTFFHFLEYLIVISRINSPKEHSPFKCIFIILEAVQLSKGYQELGKKRKMHQSLIADPQLIAKVVQSDGKCLLHTGSTSDSPKKITSSNKMKSTASVMIESPTKKELGQFYDSIKTKFTKLCSKKSVESNFYFQTGAAKKLIQTICPNIPNQAIELLLSSVGRLNFQNFITLLKKLSDKYMLSLESLYKEVLLYNTGQFSISLVFQNMRLDKREYERCKMIVAVVQKYLRSVFQYYATGLQKKQYSKLEIEIKSVIEKDNSFLGLLQYCKLMQEMGVSPAIVSQMEVGDVYGECSGSLYPHLMSFQQFSNSLILITLSVHLGNDLEGAERLIYLLEKMSQSRRGEILVKKNRLLVKQDPLYMIKIMFGDVYKGMEDKLRGESRWASLKMVESRLKTSSVVGESKGKRIKQKISMVSNEQDQMSEVYFG